MVAKRGPFASILDELRWVGRPAYRVRPSRNDLGSKGGGMSKHRSSWMAVIALVLAVGIAIPSHAITGTVRVTVVKAGVVVGAGGGRGTLSFRHRLYPFTVQGLSVGFTAGASVNKLVGRADYISELGDFAGAYSVVGAGGALVGGVGAVQLRNDKGVIITLQGAKGGLEVSANITKVVITLDQTRSTPD
jgi:hypothetical protein